MSPTLAGDSLLLHYLGISGMFILESFDKCKDLKQAGRSIWLNTATRLTLNSIPEWTNIVVLFVGFFLKTYTGPQDVFTNSTTLICSRWVSLWHPRGHRLEWDEKCINNYHTMDASNDRDLTTIQPHRTESALRAVRQVSQTRWCAYLRSWRGLERPPLGWLVPWVARALTLTHSWCLCPWCI